MHVALKQMNIKGSFFNVLKLKSNVLRLFQCRKHMMNCSRYFMESYMCLRYKEKTISVTGPTNLSTVYEGAVAEEN